MQCEQTKNIKVLQVSCTDDDRYLPPTRANIEIMKKSLEAHGQIHPISVYPITSNSYRLISGATRFRAAGELGWDTIRASIWVGSADDFQLHELVENVDRRAIAPEQRRAMRAKIKELQKKMLAEELERQKAAGVTNKGGRGKKGGTRDAARQAGMSEPTARRRRAKTKPRHNPQSDAVSDDASSAQKTSKSYGVKKHSVDWPLDLFERADAICERLNIPFSEAARRALRAWVDVQELDCRLMKEQTG